MRSKLPKPGGRARGRSLEPELLAGSMVFASCFSRICTRRGQESITRTSVCSAQQSIYFSSGVSVSSSAMVMASLPPTLVRLAQRSRPLFTCSLPKALAHREQHPQELDVVGADQLSSRSPERRSSMSRAHYPGTLRRRTCAPPWLAKRGNQAAPVPVATRPGRPGGRSWPDQCFEGGGLTSCG